MPRASAYDPREPPEIGVRNDFTSYYPSPVLTPSTATAVMTANRVYYQPIYKPGETVDRLAVEVTTLVAGSIRMGLFIGDKRNPLALLVDAGATVLSGTGVVEQSFTAVVLPRRWVWMAFVTSSGSTLRSGAPANSHLIGAGSTSAGDLALYAAFTFGAFPTAATAPTARTATAPAIFLRKS